MNTKIDITFDYKNLTNLYIGQFGEQLVKLYFIINSIDTFEPLIDDKGIDFIARLNDNSYYDVQVKTVRLKKESYIYITKETWRYKLRENLLVAFVVFEEGVAPTLLLIPSTAWERDKEAKILADRNYEGKKSKPEWGITINKKNLGLLKEKYAIEQTLQKIIQANPSSNANLLAPTLPLT